MKNKGFLFDLDGVIINTEPKYTKIWAHINDEYPTGVEHLEYIIKGMTLSKILSDYYNDDETRAKVSRRLHELEAQMEYEPFEGAIEFLIQLRKDGYPLALVTSSDSVKMENLRNKQPELLQLFDAVLTAEDVTVSKPDPQGYIKGAHRLGLEASDCFVFEDSLQGVMAGNSSGAVTIGISQTLPEETLMPYCNMVFPSLSSISISSLINADEK